MGNIQLVFADLETTAINPMYGEIITAAFLTDSDSFNFSARPMKWSFEAQKVHGITLEEASGFPEIQYGLNDLQFWAPKKSILVCHSNYSSELGRFNFDYAYLEMAYMRMDCLYEFRHQFPTSFSTHSIAKQMARDGAISPDGFSLDKLCRYFGIKLNHHNAQSDAEACYELYKKLGDVGSIEGALRGHYSKFPFDPLERAGYY